MNKPKLPPLAWRIRKPQKSIVLPWKMAVLLRNCDYETHDDIPTEYLLGAIDAFLCSMVDVDGEHELRALRKALRKALEKNEDIEFIEAEYE